MNDDSSISTYRRAKDIIASRNIRYDILFTVPDMVDKSKNIKRYTELLNSFYDKSESLQKALVTVVDLLSTDKKIDTDIERMISNYRNTYDFVTDIIESRKPTDEKVRLLEIKLEGSFNSQYSNFMKKVAARQEKKLNDLRTNSFL